MARKIKVLIVEDTPIAQKVAKMSLERMDCEVDTASTGEAALEMAIQSHYDIIFMDIGLGVTDGFIVTRQIREQSEINKNTPVVALTAHNEDEYKAKAKEVGMCEFLNKPLDSERVNEILKSLVIS